MEPSTLLSSFRKYPYILGGLLGSVCLLGLIIHSSQSIPRQKLELEQLERKIKLYESNLSAANGIDSDIQVLKERVERAERFIVKPQDTTKLFSFFLDLEKRSQVKMENPVLLEVVSTPLTPAKAALKTDGILKTVLLKYQVNLHGSLIPILSYMQAMNLMREEDSQDCYSRILECSLSRNSQAGKGDMLNAQIILCILGKQT